MGNTITELKHVVFTCGLDNVTYGAIDLTYLAIPKTVKIEIDGEEVIPERFDIYGSPLISFEKAMLTRFKEDRIRRSCKSDESLLAKVTYQELDLIETREDFDSLEGIKYSIKTLRDFNKLIVTRKRFIKHIRSHAIKDSLHEFIVFKKYVLDSCGNIFLLKVDKEIPNLPDVCSTDTLRKYVDSWSCYETSIPKHDTHCPCCTKKYTISDLRKTTFKILNHKITHLECANKYIRDQEIDQIVSLVDYVYTEKPDYEIIKNEYWPNSPIPWFLFHTSDGDIKIGWRKRVISIEWQANFKPFDMAIFNGENVTKWCTGTDYIGSTIDENTTTKNGIRGIHAWGNKDATKYLDLVHQVVNEKQKE